MVYDLVIIGSGAAGLSAAIYAGRYLMKTLVVEGSFGGETATAGTIWNYPGVPEADGFELMNAMKKQGTALGAEIISGKITSVVSEGNCFTVVVDNGKTFFGKTILFANGALRRRLGLVNEANLTGKGVHYCTTCDGPLYIGKTVAMVGGGDASVKGVNLLTQYAKKIYFIVRGKELKAEPINQEEMSKHADKIEILFETEVKEIIGEKYLEKIVLSREHGGAGELKIDGFFIEIGAEPDVAMAKAIDVDLDEHGYIAVDNLMRTNVPGVYAAGDNINIFGRFKQTITAAALGAVAATSAYNYYKTHGNLCEVHWQPAPKEAMTKL